MGWFDRKRAAEGSAPPSSSPSKDMSATVRAFDQAGQEVRLPADIYWQQLLAPALARSQDDNEALARVLQSGLREKQFAARLLPHAQRLVERESGSARSRLLLGIAQLEAGEFAAASASLATVDGSGELAAAARHAEARLADQRGEPELAEQRLEAALAADPNHVSSFLELLGRIEAKGDAAATASWLAVHHATGASWPASLRVAVGHLERQESEPALAIAKELLAKFGTSPALFGALLEEFVRCGQAKAVHELAAPTFDLKRHGPEAGLRLVRACIEVGDFARGRLLLHHVALLPRSDLIAALDELTFALDHKERSQKPAAGPANTIALAVVADPVFLVGLTNATWLVPPKSPQSRVLALTPWTVEPVEGRPLEGTAGDARFARGAAALLAEQVWLHTAQRGALVLPVVPKTGFAALSQPLPAAQVAAMWPEAQRHSVVIVTSKLRFVEGEARLEIEFFDAGKKAVIARGMARAPETDRAALVAAADSELRGLLEPGVTPTRLAANAPPAIERQVDALTSALNFILAAPNAPLAGTLMAERHQLRRLLSNAESDPVIESLDVLFASMLTLRVTHGSDIPSEFVSALREWFLRATDASTRARIAIAPLRALGQIALWRTRRDKIAAAAPEPARAWMEKLEGIRS